MEEEQVALGMADGLDNSQISDNNIGESTTGSVPSQTTDDPLSQYRESHGIPENVKTVEDLVKQFSEVNKLRGKQSNEVGELRRGLDDQRKQTERLIGMMQQRGEQQGKTQQQIEDDIVAMLAEKPVEGISTVAQRVIDQRLTPFQKQLSDISQFVSDQRINNDRMAFMEQHKLSKDDTDEMAEIIVESPDFFRSFPDNTSRMRAALIELRARRGDQSAQTQAEANIADQAKISNDQNKAKVLSTSNQRSTTKPLTVEESRARLVARMRGAGLDF